MLTFEHFFDYFFRNFTLRWSLVLNWLELIFVCVISTHACHSERVVVGPVFKLAGEVIANHVRVSQCNVLDCNLHAHDSQLSILHRHVSYNISTMLVNLPRLVFESWSVKLFLHCLVLNYFISTKRRTSPKLSLVQCWSWSADRVVTLHHFALINLLPNRPTLIKVLLIAQNSILSEIRLGGAIVASKIYFSFQGRVELLTDIRKFPFLKEWRILLLSYCRRHLGVIKIVFVWVCKHLLRSLPWW